MPYNTHHTLLAAYYKLHATHHTTLYTTPPYTLLHTTLHYTTHHTTLHTTPHYTTCHTTLHATPHYTPHVYVHTPLDLHTVFPGQESGHSAGIRC